MAVFRNHKPKPDPAPAIHSLLGKDVLFKGEVHTGADGAVCGACRRAGVRPGLVGAGRCWHGNRCTTSWCRFGISAT